MSTLTPAVGNKDHAQGSENAKIELVEYGDYQCPHCGAAYPIIKKIQERFTDQVRFVFRNFPLSEIHNYAMAAALASEAAALQDKFWEMHDMIFENQRSLSEEGLFAMADAVGLDLEKFKDDIQKSELDQKVEADFESGIRSGVNGTPSFFVNGVKFDGGAGDLYQLLIESTRS